MAAVVSEFDLIRRYFTCPAPSAVLGTGDDAAVLQPSPGSELLVSTDMLVAGTHFLLDTDPRDLGWKTLAVNLSDIAAMGGLPRWATLALALPVIDEAWLGEFSNGFFECANAFGVELIGGDTTRGALSACVTILGEVPTGQSLRRDGAKPKDIVWISGTPGRAALGLACLRGELALAEPARSECISALQRPAPRVALGLALRGIASAAIDVSDGLLADLGHILERSGVEARLQIAVSPSPTCNIETFLAGGDDYELLFTAPPGNSARIEAIAHDLHLPLTRLGEIGAGKSRKLTVLDASGSDITPRRRGYDHFG